MSVFASGKRMGMIYADGRVQNDVRGVEKHGCSQRAGGGL